MYDIKVLNNKCKMGGSDVSPQCLVKDTQMSRNKSIDDDDVDLLQLDVQE
jgi:hypothetical protein